MKYLGLDWGLKRVGVAISLGELADPLATIHINSLKMGVEKIREIIKENEIDQVVIGKPEGETGKMVEKALEAFKKEGINILETDETLSTKDAKRLMVDLGIGKKDREDDNAFSAAYILQRFLDEKI